MQECMPFFKQFPHEMMNMQYSTDTTKYGWILYLPIKKGHFLLLPLQKIIFW